MYPELFHIGWFTMNSFGLMMALAFISAGFIAHWQFKKRGVRPDFVYGLLIAAVVGGLLGAKIHYLILHPERVAAQPAERRADWCGSAACSGPSSGWSSSPFFSKERLARIMDAGAIAVSVGYAVGRLGCFLRGDDYGVPTNLPWGMSFPKGLPPTTVKVHPTQLYEIAASLVIFALLVWVISPAFQARGPVDLRVRHPGRYRAVSGGVRPHQQAGAAGSHTAAVDRHRHDRRRRRLRLVLRHPGPAAPGHRGQAGCGHGRSGQAGPQVRGKSGQAKSGQAAPAKGKPGVNKATATRGKNSGRRRK